MSYLLSVLIPVYNAEKYLQDTINSVLEQKFKNSEIILVDDGSTDKSVEIIKEFQKNTERIKLIQQSNSGASAARNRAIEAATGKYVIMLDSDDIIEPEMHYDMINKAEETNVDMVVCNYKTIKNGRICETKLNYPYNIRLERDYIENEVIKHSVCKTDESKFICAHWTIMLKRDMLIASKIRYNEMKRKEEDRPFIMHCLAYAKSMLFVEGTYYHYIKRKNSLITKYSERFNNILDTLNFYENIFSKIYDFTNDNWLNYFASEYEESILFVFIHKKDVKSVKQEIMKIITHEESIKRISRIQKGYDTLRSFYSKKDYKSIYKYYKKKFLKVRIKILIRDILVTLKIK